MGILFKPNGTLDIATAATDLPETVEKNMITSYAMQRCKNLRLDQVGVAKTRDGSSKINSTALAQTAIYRIIEQAGIRYCFAGTHIYRDESSIISGLTSTMWSGIRYNQYNSLIQSIYALNGTDRKRIEGSTVYEWGIASPSSASTTAVGALTGLTGAYNAKITYCRKEGTTVVSESNPSSAGTSRTLANGSLSVTWVASSDSQVTHVRVYRTIANGATYYHDQDIAIGTLTVDSNTADGALGSEVEENHDRPPLGTFVSGPHYNGNCFIIKDNLLYFCLAKRPEYWPTTYFLEISSIEFPGQCLVFFNGQLYYLTKHEIYLIQGTGPDSFFPYPMQAITGAQGPQAALGVAGQGIFHVGSDGVYLLSGQDRKLTQSNFDPLFRGETVNEMPGVSSLTNSWLTQFGNKIYFGYTSSGYTYPSNILVFNLDTARTSYFTYGREIRTLVVDEYNNRLLAGDNSGFIWELEDSSVTTDGVTVISWEVESKVFTLQTRRHFPRWVKYDVNASGATSATGKVILDGTIHQSHTLSENRNVRKRLVTTGNGKRGSIRLTGTGPVEIYAVETE